MSYYGDDDYDYEREREHRHRGRPPAHRNRTDMRRSQGFLDPNFGNSGLYRTRSVGAQPTPNVYIYNDMIQDANQSQRSSSRSPPYPPSPRFRSRSRVREDELADEVMGLSIENSRLRSRSRGRSDAAYRDERSDFYERQLRDLERQRSIDQERERIKQEYEIKALRAEEKRKADEAQEKEDRKRIIADHERRLREESQERKDEEERIRRKIERDEIEAKEKKEKQYKAFLAEQKAKQEEEKAKKKKEEEEFEEEMRKRLRRFGYTEAQIDIMVREEQQKNDQHKTTTTTTQITRWGENRNPVYPKIHKKYLSIDTLRYYELPWEYDSHDSDYIIIKREMDKYETEVLFEHTRKLRAGGGRALLLEPPKQEKQYAFYRKRDRSSSRIRKVGILEM